SLSNAAREKVGYYGPHKNQMARELEVRKVQVFGFPMGARGLWPSGNFKVLMAMGLDKERIWTFARLMSRRVLLYSLDLLRSFGSGRRKRRTR
ncbi:MAG: hypothetical protein ACRDAK_19300, partial [Aeromonas veronii]